MKEEIHTPHQQDTHSFTYHIQSGYTGFTWAMVIVMLIEAGGVSYLLYNWSPLLHWLHLALSIFVIVFLLADLKAVKENPILLNDCELSIKVGVRPRISLNISHITEIRIGRINYEHSRKNKDVLDLSLLGFEEPTFELVLNKPILSKSIFGGSRKVSRIFFTVDDKNQFQSLLKQQKSLTA